MNTNKRYSPVQKVEIMREHLDNQIPISTLCERFQVSPAMIYHWKKQLFEGAIALFKPKNKNQEQLQLKALQEQLTEKDAIISEIVAENLRLKKKLTGTI
jgi:transposase-like protein